MNLTKGRPNNFAKKTSNYSAALRVKKNYGVDEKQFIAEITKDFLNGYSLAEIHNNLIARYSILSDYSINVFRESYYAKVRANIAKELPFVHIESTFYRHLTIYEKLHTYFLKIKYNEGMRRSIMGRNRLLKIVDTSITVDVEGYNPNKKEFDFNKLSSDERLRLDSYLLKVQNVSTD
jgi:hypothetical protein